MKKFASFHGRITHAGLTPAGIVPVVLPTPLAVLKGVRLGLTAAATKAGATCWWSMSARPRCSSLLGYPAGENVIAQGPDLCERTAEATGIALTPRQF